VPAFGCFNQHRECLQLGAKLPSSKLDRQMLLVLIGGHPPVGTSYVAFGEDERVLCGGVNCH
jgi:hypothetical protein